MSLRPEQRKQALALGAYLKTVPDAVLAAALTEIGVQAPAEKPTAKPRLCQTCNKPYPVCRSLWADDHEFEAPPKPEGETDGR